MNSEFPESESLAVASSTSNEVSFFDELNKDLADFRNLIVDDCDAAGGQAVAKLKFQAEETQGKAVLVALEYFECCYLALFETNRQGYFIEKVDSSRSCNVILNAMTDSSSRFMRSVNGLSLALRNAQEYDLSRLLLETINSAKLKHFIPPSLPSQANLLAAVGFSATSNKSCVDAPACGFSVQLPEESAKEISSASSQEVVENACGEVSSHAQKSSNFIKQVIGFEDYLILYAGKIVFFVKTCSMLASRLPELNSALELLKKAHTGNLGDERARAKALNDFKTCTYSFLQDVITGICTDVHRNKSDSSLIEILSHVKTHLTSLLQSFLSLNDWGKYELSDDVESAVKKRGVKASELFDLIKNVSNVLNKARSCPDCKELENLNIDFACAKEYVNFVIEIMELAKIVFDGSYLLSLCECVDKMLQEGENMLLEIQKKIGGITSNNETIAPAQADHSEETAKNTFTHT
jgi:hypothetical protein